MMYAPIPGVAVIGFTGHAHHGKDQAAAFIVETWPNLARRFSFSDAIAAHCRVAHGMTRRDPRLMQDVGYAARQTQPAVWIDAVYWTIDDYRPRVALITSIRFTDEVAMVRDLGGFMIRVVRRNADGTLHASGDRDAAHATERLIDSLEVDYTIEHVSGALDAFRDATLCTYHAIGNLTRRRPR